VSAEPLQGEIEGYRTRNPPGLQRVVRTEVTFLPDAEFRPREPDCRDTRLIWCWNLERVEGKCNLVSCTTLAGGFATLGERNLFVEFKPLNE